MNLLDLTLRGSLACALVLALEYLTINRISPALRRIWWAFVPIAFLLPYRLVHLPLLRQPPRLLRRLDPVHEGGVFSSSSGFFPPFEQIAPVFPRIVLAIWLIGAILFVSVVLVRTWNGSRPWMQRRLSTSPVILDLLEDCRQTARIRAPIGLIVSNEIQTPSLLGWLRPRILLPAKIVDNASREQLRAILFHELAHFRAGDIPLGWLFILGSAVHWFNPFAHLACSRAANCREQALTNRRSPGCNNRINTVRPCSR
jgi:beta-lactamase regulating signal transducer with metallopeptidase domain